MGRRVVTLAVVAVGVLAGCTPDPAGMAAPALPVAAGASTPTPALGEDGSIPDHENISPFDADHAAIRYLDRELRQAVQEAADDAQADDVELRVTSGWRSKAYQQRLLDDAVAKYGSLAKAREFVNTPEKSTHVSGDAVDIGPTVAADWVIQHGSDHGLCQTYANEMWHFELTADPGGECPAPRSDAAG